MARGVNKVILIGSLGNDPEVKFSQTGTAIANISVATSESWKDKQTGQQQERTEWHRIVFYNRLAEIAGEYLRKGSKVYIEGSLRTRKWQDQSGQDRYTTEIVGAEMQMLDSRQDSGQAQQYAQPQQSQHAPQQPQQQAPQQRAPQQYAQPQQGYQPSAKAQRAMDEFDQDVPF